MSHLMLALAAFVFVGFGAFLFGIVVLYQVGWWVFVVAASAAFVSLAVSTRGFDTLRPR